MYVKVIYTTTGLDYNLYAVAISKLKEFVKRIVLLNSPLAFSGFIMYAEEITIEKAKAIISRAKELGLPIESYIGHKSTAELISQYLGISVEVKRAMYMPKSGDLALVFRLKKRLAKLEDIKDVKPEDLQIMYIYYY